MNGSFTYKPKAKSPRIYCRVVFDVEHVCDKIFGVVDYTDFSRALAVVPAHVALDDCGIGVLVVTHIVGFGTRLIHILQGKVRLHAREARSLGSRHDVELNEAKRIRNAATISTGKLSYLNMFDRAARLGSRAQSEIRWARERAFTIDGM